MPTYSNVEKMLFDRAKEIFPDSPEDQQRFVALAYHESGFNPAAHATKGEDSYGLFQFGPDMRKQYGMEIGAPAEQQIAAGGDYVGNLYKVHSGDWGNILAEYNLGKPRYDRYKAGKTDTATSRFQSQYLPRAESALAKIRQRSPIYAPENLAQTHKPPLEQKPMGPLAQAPFQAAVNYEPLGARQPQDDRMRKIQMLAQLGSLMLAQSRR